MYLRISLTSTTKHTNIYVPEHEINLSIQSYHVSTRRAYRVSKKLNQKLNFRYSKPKPSLDHNHSGSNELGFHFHALDSYNNIS